MAQHYTSANTSINASKLPTTFRFVKDWKSGTTNLDYGGGKFDNATEYLEGLGVTNLVYDPYNRSTEHNASVLQKVRDLGGADTITCNNVLNVIDDDEALSSVVDSCASLLKGTGVAYFKVYEGDKSGVGKVTKSDCYQRNWSASKYVGILQKAFDSVERKGDILICR